MKKRRVPAFLAAAVLGFSLVMPTFPAFAATKAEVQSSIEDLKNQQSQLESQLADLKKNKSDTESYIKELDAKIKTYLSQLEEVSAQIDKTAAEIKVTNDNLEQAKEDRETQYKALKARIQAIYESGDEDYYEIFLGASNLKDILNNSEYASKINEYDENLLVSLQETEQKIADYEKQLEEKQELQKAQKEKYELEKQNVEKIVAQKEEELVAIGSNIDSVNSDISSTQEEIDAENQVLAQIIEQERKAAEEAARKKAEEEARQKAAAEAAARKAAQEKAAAASRYSASVSGSSSSSSSSSSSYSSSSSSSSYSSSSSSSSSSGSSSSSSSSGSSSSSSYSSTGMIWPVSGSITSSFGYRSAPTAGASSFHRGIDIAAGYGTSVGAAASGTVITTGFQSAMGNYVVISHGNGVNTWYEHLASFAVSAGSTVSQGQTIGYVGMTGVTTGPHLHFGVTVGGSYVNPLAYLY